MGVEFLGFLGNLEVFWGFWRILLDFFGKVCYNGRLG